MQSFYNGNKTPQECFFLIFIHNTGQIKIKVVLTEINSVNNIGLENLDKKICL